MWWKFKKGEPKSKLRVERVQVAWYDMERNGDCFDESIIKNDGDEKDLLNRLGLWTTYVDMNEDTDKNKADRSRVFIYMDNGDCYELQMRKLTKEQQRECNNFYGGRNGN
jgi:hypothetical protein